MTPSNRYDIWSCFFPWEVSFFTRGESLVRQSVVHDPRRGLALAATARAATDDRLVLLVAPADRSHSVDH